MPHCLIGLGSNVGDRAATIQAAIAALADTGNLLSHSLLHPTRPVGGPPQSEFFNAAAVVQTALAPQDILLELQRMERHWGRERTQHWGPRTLDLDLLLYDAHALDSPELSIPHPRMSFRRFVLEPAAEIARDWVHPPTGLTVGQLLARLETRPVHVAILGSESTQIAQMAAQQVSSHLLLRAEVLPGGSKSLAETLESLRRIESNWHVAQLSGSHEVVFSDFWIGELGSGEVWKNSQAQQVAQYRVAWDSVWASLPERLVSPHLVIWHHAAPSASEEWERWQVGHSGLRFPVLALRGATWDAAVGEVVAAVEAIRS